MNTSNLVNSRFTEYKQNQFTTADSGKILIMMYDGAIRFIAEAKVKINKNDKSGQGIYIGKAISVIAELKNSLNKDVGAEVTISLERLYNFIIRELTNSNIKSNSKALDPCLRILKNLREAWALAVKKEAETLSKKTENSKPAEATAVSA